METPSQRTQPRSGRTRYQTVSNPPPGLSAVLRDMEKTFSRRGPFKNQAAIRATSARAEREYTNNGRADDLARYLLNEAVLLEDAAHGGFFFDAERASVVLDCSEKRSRTPAPEERDVRLASLMKSTRAASELSADDLPTSETGPEADPESDALTDTQGNDIMSQPETTTQAPFENGVTADDPLNPGAQPIEKRFVLFLTAGEYDAWAMIANWATTGDGLIPIPEDTDTLIGLWKGAKINYTPHRYHDIVLRFINSGLLKLESDADGRVHDQFLYRMPIHPDAFRVQQIQKRWMHEVSPQNYQLIRAVQMKYIQECLPRIYSANDLYAFMKEHLPETFLETACCRDALGIRKQDDESHKVRVIIPPGIFNKPEHGDPFLVTWPGFEAIRPVEESQIPRTTFEIACGPGDQVYVNIGDWRNEYLEFSRCVFFDDEGLLVEPLQSLHLEKRSTKLIAAVRDLLAKLQEKSSDLIKGCDDILEQRMHEEQERREREQRREMLLHQRSEAERKKRELEEELASIAAELNRA